ncbi:hypothetical protein SKAU_G00277270 [Synaphobranchus kaupii]|uniref:DDE-1 domain-containing protein n=1 Tax=Synaphobranchus kaupii TaxID=118154 RepID=A0A9Q1IP62_SYNKA|nr:hypothetical protein SKAU_G00277270 [Synaphobranchus kaupii]
MQEKKFVVFLQHFVSQTRATPTNKVLLLLDNHSSHCSIPAIQYCKEHGIILLTFPPHCSHKLQPLDRSVFGPLKRNVNVAMDAWMRCHPGTPVSIYDIPAIVAQALPQAATPRNITAGFRCTGIWPINPAIFSFEDFAPSFVTDRPEQSAATTTAAAVPASVPASVSATQPETTTAVALPVSAGLVAAAPPAATSEPSRFPFFRSSSCTAGPSTSFQLFSPEALQPYPKAGPRKGVTKGRKRKVTAILTDTPVKKVLEEAEGKNEPKAKHKLNINKKNTKETEKCPCLVCDEEFAKSVPGESWIRFREQGDYLMQPASLSIRDE